MKISFIIPTHTPSIPHLKRCVDSILKQEVPLEIIVVANGVGREKAEEALGELKDKVKLILQDELNACTARNRGFAESSGETVAFPAADFIIHRGTAKRWIEAFDQGYEAVYSGYRLLSGDPRDVYLSEPFDPYVLTSYNYIDGGNPILRSKCPEWDSSIISLQDWDFWLSAIQDKGVNKILYIPEPLFSAEPPKPGGLSNDSHMNWLKRTKVIKAKHGIPDRKICIASLQKREEAIDLAKILKADYKSMPSFKPHEYDLIYIYGFYADSTESALEHMKIFQGHKGKKIVHWVGDDVIMFAKLPWYQVHELGGMFFKDCRHYHMTPDIVHLLDNMKIQSKLRFIPYQNTGQSNGTFSVGVSSGLLSETRKALPDIKVVDRNEENAALVLLPDGSPADAIKVFLSGGLPVLQQDFPYAQKMKPLGNMINYRKIAYETVRELEEKYPFDLKEAISFYTKECNQSKFVREVTSYGKRIKARKR